MDLVVTLSILGEAKDSVTGEPVTAGQRVEIIATGKFHQLAALQKHNDIADRHDIVKEINLSKAVKNMRKTRDLDDAPDIYPELKASLTTAGVCRLTLTNVQVVELVR